MYVCIVVVIGYLGTSLFLHETHELNMLLVNTLQRVSLGRVSQFIVGVAGRLLGM